MNKTWLLMLCIALAGCANQPQNTPKSVVTPPPAQPVVVEPQPAAAQTVSNEPTLTANDACVKQLTALKTYNPKSYKRYSGEMQVLTRKTSRYLAVKEDVNPQIEDLVTGAYDSHMKSLCYRIQSTLGQTMINQANQL
ncbi:hypothetical protein [Enterobacter sp. CC120223-11]|uniref:hypothetical protein n=1 Tax=Enterobacter sp. CC120223-11 TaxID=1378073 RepID=UPI000BD03330|nr:hypothetical protein [Enterobacter sp. CC120223-11]SNY65811.1 hypothetical protein SAMN02744775_01420 [Enterobacter sp. CC120223-11]